MKAVYYKLNEYDKTHACFPFHANGVFCDGMNLFPVIQQLQGEILFEFEYKDKLNISESDAAFLAEIKSKKIPSDIIVYLDKSE